MALKLHPSHMMLDYCSQTPEPYLHNGMDDATELRLPYRLGLFEDGGTTHEACFLDSPSRLTH